MENQRNVLVQSMLEASTWNQRNKLATHLLEYDQPESKGWHHAKRLEAAEAIQQAESEKSLYGKRLHSFGINDDVVVYHTSHDEYAYHVNRSPCTYSSQTLDEYIQLLSDARSLVAHLEGGGAYEDWQP